MTEVKGTITYKPHRGNLESVGEVRKAEIKLTENHLEIVYDYDFKDSIGVEETNTCATIIHRKDISLTLTTWYHEEDKDKTHYPRIEITINGSYQQYLYVETMDEAYRIYKKLKTWIINE